MDEWVLGSTGSGMETPLATTHSERDANLLGDEHLIAKMTGIWRLLAQPLLLDTSNLQGMLAAAQSFLINSGGEFQASTELPGGKNPWIFPMLLEELRESI